MYPAKLCDQIFPPSHSPFKRNSKKEERPSVQAWHHEGAFRGRASPNDSFCASSEDCAPKKLTRSGLLESKSRSKTPKLVLIALEFASKNCFSWFLWTHTGFHETLETKTFFFGLRFGICGKSQNFEMETRVCEKF